MFFHFIASHDVVLAPPLPLYPQTTTCVRPLTVAYAFLYSYWFEKAQHHCTPLVFTVVLMCISALRQSRCDQDDCANGFIGPHYFI